MQETGYGAANLTAPSSQLPGQDEATAPIIPAKSKKQRQMGTLEQRAEVLLIELGNCKKLGMDVHWGISKKPPTRILVYVTGWTICQKCGAFLPLDDNGEVICKNTLCGLYNVRYLPETEVQETEDAK